MGRKEISEDEARERKDDLKETRDIKKEERDRTVEDKESISSLAAELEFPGFSEAGEKIRQEVTSSSEATDQRFEEQDQETINEVFTPQKEHEEELGERSDGVASDIERIAREHLTTDTAQERLNQAQSAAEQGKEAVDKVKGEQEQEREEGERERDEQQKRLESIDVEFNT
jgi:hypothetical protein